MEIGAEWLWQEVTMNVESAVKAAEELDKAVGIIAKLVRKLKAEPDLAAEKLGQALGEVARTLQVVDNATSQYLSLGIDEGALAKSSTLLLHIEGGDLCAEVERGRGHCHKMREIYEKYLDKWFDRAFNRAEHDRIANVFQGLGYGDISLFEVLAQVAETLQTEAGLVLDFVIKGEEANARARVLSALKVLRPLRKTISKTMQTLYSLQSDFVDIAAAV
jgi:hypothetical protein